MNKLINRLVCWLCGHYWEPVHEVAPENYQQPWRCRITHYACIRCGESTPRAWNGGEV